MRISDWSSDVCSSDLVAAVRGRTVTLGDPLLHDVRADQPAVIADWKHLSNVGIQNMRLQFPEAPAFGHHLEQGYNGIYMTGVFDGWISGLKIGRASCRERVCQCRSRWSPSH